MSDESAGDVTTNLLGIRKHVASVQLGCSGELFGRASGIELPWPALEAERRYGGS